MADPTDKCPSDLAASVPLFDPSGLPLRSWCAGSREDPLTGLIAFPDFHSCLPRELAAALAAGGLVALAIGDVDGLKQHVEDANATDPSCFGHLAGNRVMARLGAVTRTWFHEQSFAAGCAATFGGDEVIVAAAIDEPVGFYRILTVLRNRLADALPTPVSFAFAIASADHLPADRDRRGWRHTFTDQLLALVDRCLFAHKAVRRSGGDGGIIAVTEAPCDDATNAPEALLPLPAAGQRLHVTARAATLSGRDVVLLPCRGPAGLRGIRLRTAIGNQAARTTTVTSYRGQASLPAAPRTTPGTSIPMTLQPIRPPALATLPEDLTAALARSGLDWAVLPAAEQAQMLHLIRESADAAVRESRITTAVGAVAVHTRRTP